MHGACLARPGTYAEAEYAYISVQADKGMMYCRPGTLPMRRDTMHTPATLMACRQRRGRIGPLGRGHDTLPGTWPSEFGAVLQCSNFRLHAVT
jgi:hypothetical protein